MKRRLVRLSVVASLGLASMTTGALAVGEVSTLDTLIIYSQGAADKYQGDAETRIEHLIETTNKIYEDSGLNVKLNPVKIQQYDMNDSATSGEVLGSIRADETIAQLRNDVGADNVVMYRPYANDGNCGIAYQNNYLNNSNATWVEKYMYAHVTIGCGGYVTAHEVGHNTGLGHSAKQGSKGAYEYARGHGVQDTFTTVMAYSGVYNGKKIYKYSSPSLDCNGLPCGIEEGETNAADSVKALRQTIPLVEKFRAHIDQPDNNNTDDNNGTVDDNAKKLEAALKAYTDQQTVVTDNRQMLKEKRTELEELKTTFLDAREEYYDIRADFFDARTTLKEILSDYRSVRTSYRQARDDYRAKLISRDELLEKRADFLDVREEYRTFRSEEIIPLRKELVSYRTEVLKPSYAAYKEGVESYRTFYSDVYKASKTKLEELKKAYEDLKKSLGQ